MNSTKRLISLSLVLVCAAALLPAAASARADIDRGDYTGTTKQAPSEGAKAFAGRIEISVGILSDPPRIFSIELTAQLRCEDGSTRNVKYDEVIYGPQLDSKHRFTYQDGGLEVRGRFNTKGKAHGKFSYTVDTCSVTRASWKAAS
jgi:hypothetical protein